MEKLLNQTKNIVMAEEVIRAISFSERAIGLLGKSKLDSSKALWIYRCKDIHTFFMRFPIDVVFVDQNLKVTDVVKNVKPWRFVFRWKANSVFEFNGGSLSKATVEKGDQLHVGA